MDERVLRGTVRYAEYTERVIGRMGRRHVVAEMSPTPLRQDDKGRSVMDGIQIILAWGLAFVIVGAAVRKAWEIWFGR